MIVIFGKLFSRGISLRISNAGKSLKNEFTGIRHEFEEHLQAINENTNEISANYEYICEIESKLDRLSERVEQMQLALENSGMVVPHGKTFDVKRLTHREKQVFLVIYTLEDHDGITYLEIAERLGISEQLAGNYVTSMIEKGVPIVKRYSNSKPHLRLDQEFKTLQAEENILQVGLEEFGF